jgi:hypothetical protein
VSQLGNEIVRSLDQEPEKWTMVDDDGHAPNDMYYDGGRAILRRSRYSGELVFNVLLARTNGSDIPDIQLGWFDTWRIERAVQRWAERRALLIFSPLQQLIDEKLKEL